MPLFRRTTVLYLTIWCLLSSWLCFGGLELLEQANLMPEVEDLDEVALLQVASGLRSKSEIASRADTHGTPLAKVATEPAVRLSLHTVHQFISLVGHSPPSLRLHQQLSVYRI